MSTKNLGVMSIGLKMPIFHEGDDVAKIVTDEIARMVYEKDITIDEGDVIAITESVVARAEGNYIMVDDIADAIKKLFGENATIGVLWPIYSRNRFSMILKGIARGASKVVIQLNNGKDEVGNDIYNPFTDVDIREYYREVVENENAECKIYQSNYVSDILKFTNNVVISSLHRRRSVAINFESAVSNIDEWRYVTLEDLFFMPNDEQSYCEYGLLGSNKATEEKLKLFPRRATCMELVKNIQSIIKERFDKNVEVMVYGDGCFKDPKCGIWEFADPVVSPGYTEGLNGTPNELKLKYLIDNENLSAEDLKERIKAKNDLYGQMSSMGTTPRRYTDLIGSLCDLTSGSGDRGCPVVLVKNYFTNYNS